MAAKLFLFKRAVDLLNYSLILGQQYTHHYSRNILQKIVNYDVASIELHVMA